jgi:hypothetical protein
LLRLVICSFKFSLATSRTRWVRSDCWRVTRSGHNGQSFWPNNFGQEEAGHVAVTAGRGVEANLHALSWEVTACECSTVADLSTIPVAQVRVRSLCDLVMRRNVPVRGHGGGCRREGDPVRCAVLGVSRSSSADLPGVGLTLCLFICLSFQK